MMFGLFSDVLTEFASSGRLTCVIFGYEKVTLHGRKIWPGFSISYAVAAHLAGWVTLCVAAAVMASNMLTFSACLTGIKIPDVVYGMAATETTLFFCFGCVQMYTLWKKEPERKRPRTLDGMINYKTFKITWETHLKAATDAAKQQRVSLPDHYVISQNEMAQLEKKRIDLFNSNPPAFVLPLSWRPDFGGGGAPTMDVLWTVWKQ